MHLSVGRISADRLSVFGATPLPACAHYPLKGCRNLVYFHQVAIRRFQCENDVKGGPALISGLWLSEAVAAMRSLRAHQPAHSAHHIALLLKTMTGYSRWIDPIACQPASPIWANPASASVGLGAGSLPLGCLAVCAAMGEFYNQGYEEVNNQSYAMDKKKAPRAAGRGFWIGALPTVGLDAP